MRHWLREARVRVGPDGTLTGPAAEPPAPEAGRPAPAEAGISGTEPTSAPAGKRPADPADQAALAELNHLVQLGYLTGVTWSFEAEGPAHARFFRAVATCQLSGVPGELTGSGGAGTKAAAKAAAVRALLEAAARS
jgi:hypothetical protein